jgi:hypothetical protein
MTPGPLSILRDTAATHFALPIDVANDYSTFDVSPPMPSGAPAPSYRLRVSFANLHALRPRLSLSVLHRHAEHVDKPQPLRKRIPALC